MKFKVKAKEDEAYPVEVSEPSDEPRYPCIYLDDILPADVVKKLNVGEEFSITLKGKISSLTHREGESYGPSTEVRMSVTAGEVAEDNEFSDLADLD